MGEEPETLANAVGMRWVKEWLLEVRLASRMPNRKYKVARYVLQERLQIFWINIHKWRKWVSLEFGYDPHFRNVDQSPMHRNEAGSKCFKTITMKNSCKIPLIENHAHTRQRMSLSTVSNYSIKSMDDRLWKP